jgi:hypothetical protein
MITMKNYSYNVNIYTEDEMTFRTNDVRGALDTFLNAKVQGVHCDLLDGHTGEVLAIANCPDCEDCATPSTMLMIKGMLFESLEGEEIAPEDEEDDPEPETVEPDDLFTFLEQKVAEGKAVKLGGLLS